MSPLLSHVALLIGLPLFTMCGVRWASRIPAPTDHLCVCGCPYSTHDHYRRGTDCGRCGRLSCAQFRARTGAGYEPTYARNS